jgi:chitin disaccharide deacetylase
VVRFRAVFAIIVVLGAVRASTTQPATQPTEIRLIVRGDDMGAAQAINEGCIEAYKNGIVRSVEVIVPGPWFLDAVRLLKENPDLDIGVHLTLTSEWHRIKWRPLTHGPSLVDADGYLHPTIAAFMSAKPNLSEVERELRAQIETAKRHLGERISHVSAHMGAATETPALKALTEELAKEYKLRNDYAATSAGSFGNMTFSSDQREKALMALLEKLQAGDWLLIEHPAFDTPELRGLGHQGYDNVAGDRSNVRRAFTSERVMKLVKRRGIKLIGYKDL